MIKEILTTGEVARYCHVNFRTVIRWIERGAIESYKLPGRGDNRIQTRTLVEFLRTNGMPIHDDLLASKILIYTEPENLNETLKNLAKQLRQKNWDPIFIIDPYQLGYLIAKSSAAAVVMTNPEDLENVAKIVRSAEKTQNSPTKIILLSKEEHTVQDDINAHTTRNASEVLALMELEQSA